MSDDAMKFKVTVEIDGKTEMTISGDRLTDRSISYSGTVVNLALQKQIVTALQGALDQARDVHIRLHGGAVYCNFADDPATAGRLISDRLSALEQQLLRIEERLELQTASGLLGSQPRRVRR